MYRKPLTVLFLLLFFIITLHAQFDLRPAKDTTIGSNLPIKRNKDSTFKNLIFNRIVKFDSFTFYKKEDFKGTVFKEEAQFNWTKFKDSVMFNEVKFNKRCWFSNSDFESYSYFRNSHFDTLAIFSLSIFDSSEFLEAKFNDGALFPGATFKNATSFAFASFKKSAVFTGIHLNENSSINFFNTQFGDLIYFDRVYKIYKQIRFTDADFTTNKLYSDINRKWHFINLYKSDIPNIRIDYEHFRLCFFISNNNDLIIKKIGYYPFDSVDFEGRKYSFHNPKLFHVLRNSSQFKTYVKQIFPSCKTSDDIVDIFLDRCIKNHSFPARLSSDEIISTYEKVLKSFEVEGQKISYQNLDIEYKDFKYGWFILPHIWNCYGYHKEWIFFWTLGLLIFFTLITTIFLSKLDRTKSSNGIYYIDKLKEDLPNKYLKTIQNRFWYSLLYTSIIFFSLSLKLENINFKKIGILYIILVYLVGLLCIAYIVDFVISK